MITECSGRRGRRFKSCRIDSWQGHRKPLGIRVSGSFYFLQAAEKWQEFRVLPNSLPNIHLGE